jgi:mRNA interferase RelE/StbE
MYKLKIIPQAQKDLDTLPAKIFNRIKSAILNLSEDPRPYGAIKLTGQEGYRIREGDYRILYRIDDSSKEIYIYRLKHRKEVYR